jgi:FkbM family methyltransferase
MKPLRVIGYFRPIRKEVATGIFMALDPEDLVSMAILEKGTWQPEVRRAIEGGLSKGSVLVDVGAHIGWNSLTAVPVIGPHGRILAVEPNPDTLRELRANIADSHATNVLVEPFACSDHEQTLTLYAGPEYNTGEATEFKDIANTEPRAERQRTYTVRAKTLDSLVWAAGVSRVDVVKIDVEGAELSVLQGAGETLRKYHPRLVIELNPLMLPAMHASAADVDKLLESAGYHRKEQVDEMDWQYTAN